MEESNAQKDKTRFIMLAIRRALLMIVQAIEQAYGIDPKERVVIVIEKSNS